MKKQEKQAQAESLHQALGKAQCIILSGFEGLTVAQDTALRRKVAQAGARYRVVKNSVIERAIQGTSAEPLVKTLRGTTSLAYTEGDPLKLAKALTAYARENPALVFKAGIVEGRVVSLADLHVVSNLPSRADLLAKGLFLIKVPAQRVTLTLSRVAGQLAAVIHQAVMEKKFKEAAGN